MTTTAAELIAKHAKLPDYPGAYVLGAHDRRLTLYSQQVRAHNLAYAISAIHRESRISVGVIGAGIGGLTVATALAAEGMNVSIYEAASRPLHLYSEARHRWIHPSYLDWPDLKSHLVTAELPFFSWDPGDAATVTSRWLAEWRVLEKKLRGQVTAHFQVRDVQFTPTTQSQPARISWNGPRSNDNWVASHDVVVFAVGYGTDQPVRQFQNVSDSYWKPDKWIAEDPGEKRILISGIGDGGLVDLFRVTLLRFDLEKAVQDLLGVALPLQVRRAIRDLERPEGRPTHEESDSFYRNLKLDNAIEAFRRQLYPDRKVSLNGPVDGPFALRTAPINKLILSQLRHIDGAFRYLPGQIDTLTSTAEGGWRVKLEGSGREYTFDDIILRHGPVGGLETQFPNLQEAFRILQEQLPPARSDPTRHPLWPSGWFSTDVWLSTRSNVENACWKVQPPSKGRRFTGETLFVVFEDGEMPIPEEQLKYVLYRDRNDVQRHRVKSPLTGRPIRQESDLLR